jgi:hypothetical protein
MGPNVIDGRVKFFNAAARAVAKRHSLPAFPEYDIDLAEADLRKAMQTGFGFDDDGRPIEM